MDLDLSSVPLNNSSDMNLERRLDNIHYMIREVARHDRLLRRQLLRQLLDPLESIILTLESTVGDEQQTGEGSAATEERPAEVTKQCENCNGYMEVNSLCKKDGAAKNNDEECSFFDCNICYDLARDPVVTCCGHLFCWPCIYRWLRHHSGANECPVCKGKVTVKSMTPIYGQGNDVRMRDEDCSLEIPQRPQARHAERAMATESTTAEVSLSFQLTRDIQPPPIIIRRITSAREAASSGLIPAMDIIDDGNSGDAVSSESRQTVHNAIEIDPTVAPSTSSRRRINIARMSGFESGDSRSNRRRRLH